MDLGPFQQQLQEKAASVRLVPESRKNRVDWWLHHMPNVDHKPGLFLREHEV